jgi:hypothetical protein
MIRVVLDTNIVVSALLTPQGPPARVFLMILLQQDGKRWWGFAPSYSAHVRWGERGAPVLLLETVIGPNSCTGRAVESHISRKTSEIPELPGRSAIDRSVCGFH